MILKKLLKHAGVVAFAAFAVTLATTNWDAVGVVPGVSSAVVAAFLGRFVFLAALWAVIVFVVVGVRATFRPGP